MRFALIAAVLLTLASPTGAEIYRWTDARGNVHFSQDLSQVPPERRRRPPPLGPTPAASSSTPRAGPRRPPPARGCAPAWAASCASPSSGAAP